jgi:hypothetical protein
MMTLFPLMLAQNQYSFSGAESGGHVKVVDVRKSSAMAVSPLALSVSRLDRSVLGFRQRTERL